MYRSFVVSSMIAARAGQTASHASSQLFQPCCFRPQQSPPPGRQGSDFTRRRRRGLESAAAHYAGVRRSRGRQRRVDSGKMAANANQTGLRKPTSSRRQHALLMPRRAAHTSMIAIPSIFSRRCCCACAGLPSMSQSSTKPGSEKAPRWQHGGLQDYDARALQVACAGAAQ